MGPDGYCRQGLEGTRGPKQNAHRMPTSSSCLGCWVQAGAREVHSLEMALELQRMAASMAAVREEEAAQRCEDLEQRLRWGTQRRLLGCWRAGWLSNPYVDAHTW